MKNLKGKISLVTGSSRGIGKAIALDLAKKGAVLILHASKKSLQAERSLGEIKNYSSESKIFYARVENYQAVTRWAKKIKRVYKNIDILVNNAGINKDKLINKMSYKEWDDVIKVNLYGIFNVTRNLIDIINKNGRIINISSIVGLTGAFGQSNYAASKSGILGFTKSLAIELKKRKITVNAVCPGYTATEMVKKIPVKILKEFILPKIPLGRLAKPWEIASLVSYLCTSEADYITSQVIKVSGGI